MSLRSSTEMPAKLARFACIVLWLATPAHAAEFATPAELYGPLFERVQLERVYPDSKTFVDALPVRPPEQVLADYEAERKRARISICASSSRRISRRRRRRRRRVSHGAGPGRARAHRCAVERARAQAGGSAALLVATARCRDRYIVPGGRFNEIYYWDSYFTMLGLEESGRHDLTVSMVDNFAWLIDQFGHIPNGNRTYYLSRSQPPFFAAMVELRRAARWRKRLSQVPAAAAARVCVLDGRRGGSLAPGAAHRRVVRLARWHGAQSLLGRSRHAARGILSRGRRDRARVATRPAADVYRNLRAAAESGWDFSSRWFADGKTLATIRTTDLIPVDLNSLLYQLELTIAKALRGHSRRRPA